MGITEGTKSYYQEKRVIEFVMSTWKRECGW